MAKKRKWKVIKRYLGRSSKDPESLARGVGLGLFVGFLPSVGFQVILAFLLAGLLNANRVAAVVGTLVTNPFTTIPFSVLSLWIGDLILPGSTLVNYSIESFDWRTLTSASGHFVAAYLLGCLALAVASGSAGYVGMRLYYVNAKSNLNSKKENL